MLFNSYIFIFAYLPLVLAGFFIIGRWHALAAAGWLALASVVFYSWWNWHFTFILLVSVAFNYRIGVELSRRVADGGATAVKWLLRGGVAANLLALGYFKYMNFFVETASQLLQRHLDWTAVVLPIGISFFTFTQIAFLVDSARGKAREPNFIHYLLFVTYFPHLIAGPILHHAEMMPQFRQPATYSPRADAFAVGLTVFMIGLFKKVVLADSVGIFADRAFAPEHSHALTLLEAWGGVLSYTFQIYFDFSAYSDMAIGLSRAFNIKLPANFESPYKARSIIDFWRRWHMTLSRFLRDYLYIALGGNRRGQVTRYANLLATMALGGLWHGAGWTFLIWGVLHGCYLIVNHGWHRIRSTLGWDEVNGGAIGRFAAWALTFLAVIFAWVFFRAPNIGTAFDVLGAMAGQNGMILPTPGGGHLMAWLTPILVNHGVVFGELPAFAGADEMWWLLGLLTAALALPNLRQIMIDEELIVNPVPGPATARWQRWRPHPIWALASFAAFIISLTKMTGVSQFLYFQF